ESICFGRKGLSVLSRITNKKIDVRYMAVMDITCFFGREKEEAKKKEFVIRERLYVRNTGILFLECLRNTVFIPVIEIEVDCWKEYLGGFWKATDIHIKTNALSSLCLLTPAPGVACTGPRWDSAARRRLGWFFCQAPP
ncbi:MAG: uncharacterized protein A8A55_3551, partial [Amphiamblys sp. WSBS2006]